MDYNADAELNEMLAGMPRLAVAEILRVHINTVDNWTRNGVPKHNAGSVHRAYLEHTENIEPGALRFCRYNRNIDCNDLPRECERCGWNPEVTRRRIAKYREEKEAKD